MSAFFNWFAAPPAEAAIEIGPEAVSIAALSGRDDANVRAFAIEPLPPGALVPSLTSANLVDQRAVSSALRTALDRFGAKPRRVALLVPDVMARVSLVRFERVPRKAEDLEQLVRWQVRKSAPFPIDEAALSVTPAASAGRDAGEFVAVLARRTVVREYEGLCEELGMEPGLVDLSTFGVVNLLLTSSVPAGDWLVVHVRPEYASLAIMRGNALIFFRSVPGADVETLADAVHQTAMYYQDRLSGHGFAQVLFGGVGRSASALDTARRGLEDRLGTAVRQIHASRPATLSDRIAAEPELQAMLAPLVGTLLRMRARIAA